MLQSGAGGGGGGGGRNGTLLRAQSADSVDLTSDYVLGHCFATRARTAPDEADYFYVLGYAGLMAPWSACVACREKMPEWVAVLEPAISSGDTQLWQDLWGLPGEYWRRRGGRDHIVPSTTIWPFADVPSLTRPPIRLLEEINHDAAPPYHGAPIEKDLEQ